MAKTIFKEIMIILLICIAIVLIMAVLFYNYIPTNKIIPSKVTAYQTPENIQTEIAEDTIGSYTTQEKEYTIENTDLNKYQASQSYNPGKPDPFAEYSVENSTGNSTNNGPNSGTIDQNTTDNYYNSANVVTGGK